MGQICKILRQPKIRVNVQKSNSSQLALLKRTKMDTLTKRETIYGPRIMRGLVPRWLDTKIPDFSLSLHERKSTRFGIIGVPTWGFSDKNKSKETQQQTAITLRGKRGFEVFYINNSSPWGRDEVAISFAHSISSNFTRFESLIHIRFNHHQETKRVSRLVND